METRNNFVFEVLREANILNTDIRTETFRVNDIPYTKNVDAAKALYVDIDYQTEGCEEVSQSFLIIEDNHETIKEVIIDSQYYNSNIEGELTEQQVNEIANDKVQFGCFIGSRNEEGEYHISMVNDTQYRVYEVY